MCSLFGMENFQGDLTDIVRASAGAYACGNGSSSELDPISDWQFPSDPMNFSSSIEAPPRDHNNSNNNNNFGDPFSTFRDPLFDELDISSGSFFGTTTSSEIMSAGGVEGGGFGSGGGGAGVGDGGMLFDAKIKRPNLFSRMLQISPTAKSASVSSCESPVLGSPTSSKPTAAIVSGDMVNSNSSKACLIDNSGMQISSPRNPGIKRRKSQAKKVVCIPAPAAANSRASGEVVPSDLWAWRKYGQKPIKGSPYPRGYYRCSSSKGCSARKQVERSRTDPNMLVITYTSEHNHPWPTQRNALAGSTRSQPARNNANSKTTTTSSTISQPQKSSSHSKEDEHMKENNSSSNNAVLDESIISVNVKEEAEVEAVDKQLDNMEDVEFGSEGIAYAGSASLQSDDFFADLGELEGDPLSQLFSQGFSGNEQKENKSLDPFSLYDWASYNSSSNSSATPFEEAKRGL